MRLLNEYLVIGDSCLNSSNVHFGSVSFEIEQVLYIDNCSIRSGCRYFQLFEKVSKILTQYSIEHKLRFEIEGTANSKICDTPLVFFSQSNS